MIKLLMLHVVLSINSMYNKCEVRPLYNYARKEILLINEFVSKQDDLQGSDIKLDLLLKPKVSSEAV